jgi:hypothetical protein
VQIQMYSQFKNSLTGSFSRKIDILNQKMIL